ncbi:uncharacterized protein LOC133625559 [Colius striatus]|uniref:uncharacterized protein LOC133625559 n=1 Tax=Colius striatus TaxID=57412 RepID=UPI002B1D1663|nr:uncharacterized protein LOC133625559 [Colius striatus]
MLADMLVWWYYMSSYLHHVCPVIVFLVGGKMYKILMLLHWMGLAYDMILSWVIKLGWYVYMAFMAFLSLPRFLLELNNGTQFMGKADMCNCSHYVIYPHFNNTWNVLITMSVVFSHVSTLAWIVKFFFRAVRKGIQNMDRCPGSFLPVKIWRTQEPIPNSAVPEPVAVTTVDTQTETTDTIAVESECQSVPVSVAPVQKKKYTKKPVRSTKDEDEQGTSQKEEEVEPEIISRSLSLNELRDVRKDYSRRPEYPERPRPIFAVHLNLDPRKCLRICPSVNFGIYYMPYLDNTKVLCKISNA